MMEGWKDGIVEGWPFDSAQGDIEKLVKLNDGMMEGWKVGMVGRLEWWPFDSAQGDNEKLVKLNDGMME